MSVQPGADDHLRTVAANGRVLWHGRAYRDDRLIAFAGEQVHVCEMPGGGLFVWASTGDPGWIELRPEPRDQEYPHAGQEGQPSSKLRDESYARIFLRELVAILDDATKQEPSTTPRSTLIDDAYAELRAAGGALAALAAEIYSADPVTEKHRRQLWDASIRWGNVSANLSAALDFIGEDY